MRHTGVAIASCLIWISAWIVVGCFSLSKPPRRATRKTYSPKNGKLVDTKSPSLSFARDYRSSFSIGEQIQRAQTIDELLQVASTLWLPTDPDLAPHLVHQQVHHEKRLRWSSQLLHKLGEILLSVHDDSSSLRYLDLCSDPRLHRAVMAAAIPFRDDASIDRKSKEGRYLKDALVGLHNILCLTYSAFETNEESTFSDNLESGLTQLFERSEALADYMSLPHAVEVRWACQGIRSRTQCLQQNFSDQSPLDARVSNLPFDILPACIKWEVVLPDALTRLQQEIQFSMDTIVTRAGTSVTERRSTAWIADPDIGALAYSGKLMQPQPISPVVRDIMSQVETKVLDNNFDEEDATFATFPRPFFDCALCNYYPNGDSACKFHTDPEHGSYWERLTCVVAAGAPRRFAFRPIPSITSWAEWEVSTISEATNLVDDHVPAVITLFSGDVVKMFATCNDEFLHAVYPQEQQQQREQSNTTQGRVSLVLKRSILRNGRRGHGLLGQGRRARRRQTQQ